MSEANQRMPCAPTWRSSDHRGNRNDQHRQDSLRVAHGKISFRSGHDYTTSRVVEWGMQFGGFAGETLFYLRIEEDPDAPLRTKS